MRARIQQAKPAAHATGFFGVLPELLALQRDVDRRLAEMAHEATMLHLATENRRKAHAPVYARKREVLRARILTAIRDLGPCTVYQLVKRVGVDCSCLRHHLKEMKDGGLVEHSGSRRQFIWRAL